VKVSVVVPAFNEERLLEGSLAAIRDAMAVFPQSELIVCDNNSTDRTAEIARAAGATVVFEPVNQIARARNRGAAGASGDWLVFVDADSYPDAALFKAALKEMRGGKCIGGGATVAFDIRDPLKPREIAYGILLLASDESSYVTGIGLSVDGGLTAVTQRS
jgi:glycosyltransferase involved in cell wall biosynthesis